MVIELLLWAVFGLIASSAGQKDYEITQVKINGEVQELKEPIMIRTEL